MKLLFLTAALLAVTAASAQDQPLVMKANLIVGAHREGNYWPSPAAKEPQYNTWTWGPRYEFTVLGPLAGGSQLSIDTFKPDGSLWLSYPIQTPETGPGDAHRFNVPNRHDEKKLIPITGTFSFKIILKNELTKTNVALYQGKFTVNKFHVGNNLPQFRNQFEYFVENDWRLPFGLLFTDNQMDAEAPRLRILMWFRDGEKVLTTEDVACYVFYNGKQIASTKTNGGAVSKLQVNTSGSNNGDPGWRSMVFFVNQISTGLALQAPFGGFKQSSANTFKEQGPAALEFFTRAKTVYVTY